VDAGRTYEVRKGPQPASAGFAETILQRCQTVSPDDALLFFCTGRASCRSQSAHLPQPDWSDFVSRPARGLRLLPGVAHWTGGRPPRSPPSMKRIGLDVPELPHDHHKVGLLTAACFTPTCDFGLHALQACLTASGVAGSTTSSRPWGKTPISCGSVCGRATTPLREPATTLSESFRVLTSRTA
jgi:hypothetical protein